MAVRHSSADCAAFVSMNDGFQEDFLVERAGVLAVGDLRRGGAVASGCVTPKLRIAEFKNIWLT